MLQKLNFPFDLNSFELSQKSQRSITPLSIKDKIEFLKTYFETLDKGEIPFVLNPDLPRKVTQDLSKNFQSRDAELGHCICTSGTTSAKPKVFYFELNKTLKNAKAHNMSLNITSEKTVLFPLPFTHSFGLTVGIWAHLEHDLYFSDVPLGALDILNNLAGIDILYLTPSLARQIIKYAPRFKGEIVCPSIISIGSSLFFENEAYKLKEIFKDSKLYYTYGVTEMGPRVSTHQVDSPKDVPNNLPIGKPLPGISMMEKENTLWIESPYASVDVSLPFNSHDLVSNGIIRGRDDEVIISQGKNIYPKEIETLLKDFGLCALVGHPSKLYGEVPILIFENQVNETDVWSFLKEHLPESHLPKQIIMGENIPMTNMQKIKRNQLKDKLKEIL